MMRFMKLLAALLLFVGTASARAEPAQFNLVGPMLRASVTRGSVTLPISEVPNLQAGDRLVIGADLPDTQSQRYLLVAGLLREVTNPPPQSVVFQL